MDSVLACVGTQESMLHRASGKFVSYVGVPSNSRRWRVPLHEFGGVER